jgi:hypothetical protein
MIGSSDEILNNFSSSNVHFFTCMCGDLAIIFLQLMLDVINIDISPKTQEGLPLLGKYN